MDNYAPYYVTYRAKSLENSNKWVYGDLIRGNAKNEYHDMIYTENCEMLPIDRLTISQSTCLTAINAHNIFVNDFVKVYCKVPWIDYRYHDGTLKQLTYIGEIVVREFAFQLNVFKANDKYKHDLCMGIFSIPEFWQPRTFEVISNREDDPLFESKVYDGIIS
jgi:hypothetical protein